MLEPAERALMLGEMRGFLRTTQAILAAAGRGDVTPVPALARVQGMQAARDVPATLTAKLPLEFKQLGFSVHQDFDRIALDAGALQDSKYTLGQLAETLNKGATGASLHPCPSPRSDRRVRGLPRRLSAGSGRCRPVTAEG